MLGFPPALSALCPHSPAARPASWEVFPLAPLLQRVFLFSGQPSKFPGLSQAQKSSLKLMLPLFTKTSNYGNCPSPWTHPLNRVERLRQGKATRVSPFCPARSLCSLSPLKKDGHCPNLCSSASTTLCVSSKAQGPQSSDTNRHFSNRALARSNLLSRFAHAALGCDAAQ